MLFSPNTRLGRFFHRRNILRWRKAARAASKTDLGTLSRYNEIAKKLIRQVDSFHLEAEGRLALPPLGATTFPRPPGSDWHWRPKAWRGPVAIRGIAPALAKMELSNELVIFHDCKEAEIILRQERNMREIDLSPYRVDLEVFHFDGSYLSLVVEVPPESCENLKKNHLIRLAAIIERERPTTIYARLNVKNGPNTEQVLLTLPDATTETMVEFDLAYSGLNQQRVERMWVDLMIEQPAMNKISFRDLTLCRYPRAEI